MSMEAWLWLQGLGFSFHTSFHFVLPCFDLLCILSYKYQVNLDEARTYEILSLGSPVLKDPILDGSNDFLHVLTEKQVTQI